jgi:multiple sugar transport system ATP-binding protein
VTLVTAAGEALKARVPASVRIGPGDHAGVSFVASKLSVFDGASGRALRSDLHTAPAETARG